MKLSITEDVVMLNTQINNQNTKECPENISVEELTEQIRLALRDLFVAKIEKSGEKGLTLAFLSGEKFLLSVEEGV